jgi:UPF0271 protein
MVASTHLRRIDLNCDCGESFGNWRIDQEADLFAVMSSANIACGFHAGDPLTMREAVLRALENDVAIGAHPGLPDLLGFGRREMTISAEDTYAYIVYQVGALQATARALGATVRHVKAHGALETVLERYEECAEAAVNAILAVFDDPVVYWRASPTPDPFSEEAKRRGVRVVGEFYPDLSYDGRGVIAIERAKLARDPASVTAGVRRFLDEGTVIATDGTPVPLVAESICVHSDGPNALQLARAVADAVEAAGHIVGSPTAAEGAR